jgi:hypothetical protein
MLHGPRRTSCSCTSARRKPGATAENLESTLDSVEQTCNSHLSKEQGSGAKHTGYFFQIDNTGPRLFLTASQLHRQISWTGWRLEGGRPVTDRHLMTCVRPGKDDGAKERVTSFWRMKAGHPGLRAFVTFSTCFSSSQTLHPAVRRTSDTSSQGKPKERWVMECPQDSTVRRSSFLAGITTA